MIVWVGDQPDYQRARGLFVIVEMFYLDWDGNERYTLAPKLVNLYNLSV